MSNTISQARQALRDLARERVVVVADPHTSFTGQPRHMPVELGELAGKAFVAVQEAFRVAEELRVESRQQPVIWNDDKDLAAKAEAADRIEAAIWGALKS